MIGRMILAGLVAGMLAGASSARAGDGTGLSICFEEWAPYSAMQDGRPVGIGVEVLEAAFAPAGLTVTFEELPYQRCIDSVRAGRHDGILYTSDEVELVAATEVTAYWLLGAFVARESPLRRLEGLEQFNGLRVGMVTGYEYPEQILAHLPAWQVDKVTDATLNLRKVGAGRLDVTIDDVFWGTDIIGKEGLAARLLLPYVMAVAQQPHFAPGRQDLARQFDQGAAALRASGRLDEIYFRHMRQTFTEIEQSARLARYAGS